MNVEMLQKLQNTKELIADQHDGSYELMRAIVEAYRNVDALILDYNDLNAIYLMSVGTWKHGVPVKKAIIEKSHLSQSSKDNLTDLIDQIQSKAFSGEYSNHEPTTSRKGVFGMFGTGFYSFEKKTDDRSVQEFIRMCVDISDMNDDEEIYKRAGLVLNNKFKGMRAASASMVLHCLKPYTFPVLNSNMGSESIFEALDIKLNRKSDIDTYIENCRAIKTFRDQNLPFKNYRILDMAAWELGKVTIDPIDDVIRQYKADFVNRDKEERYKWEAIKCFQDHWDIDAYNFREMLERALAKTFNLLTTGRTFAKGMILYFAEKDPEAVRKMFGELYDESIDVVNRVDTFLHGVNQLFEKYKDPSIETMKQHYQRPNIICIYLFFKYPDKYYLYQYGKFKTFSKKIGYETTVKAGDSQNIAGYFEMCDAVLGKVMDDTELQNLSKTRLNQDCYDDDEFHMLTDDIVYFGSKLGEVYWPSLSEYDPGINKEKWIELIRDKSVFNQTSLGIMKRIFDVGGEATCLQLSQTYGEAQNYYNIGSTNLARRVWKATNCQRLEDDFSKLWPILYVGRETSDDEAGVWSWKLRTELKDAIEELYDEVFNEGEVVNEVVNYNKNFILYGPPGTGKTYQTIHYSVAIIEEKPLARIKEEDYEKVIERYNQYRNDGYIEFTTFHQSFGYEEFIEGIKPVLYSSEEDQEGAEIAYKVEAGIFKAFCEKASKPKIRLENNFGFSENPTVWKVSLAGTGDNPIRQDCMNNGYIRIGWDEYGPNITDEIDFKAGGKVVLNAFVNRMQIGDIILSCYSERTIDAIGVVEGQYEWRGEFGDYCRLRKVKWLIKGIDFDIFEMNKNLVMTLSTVHKMNVSVGDVIQILNEFSVNSGIEYEADEKFVFIIDEINRGNISKIFGELITLIEPTKRLGQQESMKLKLPYSRENFGVPNNIYIIGTMNTADRSIALLDTALRRRFDFIETQPDISVLSGLEIEGISIPELLSKINKRIAVLIDREHTIGHSYFLKLKDNPTLDCLADVFEFNLIPLLQEYFYEDYEKIRLVLGDTHKERDEQFVWENQIDFFDLFGGASFDFDEMPTYQINKFALKNINSYKNI